MIRELRTPLAIAAAVAAIFFATGCDQGGDGERRAGEGEKKAPEKKGGEEEGKAGQEEHRAMVAHAEIKDPEGKTLGHVTFTEVEGGLEVQAEVEGVRQGKHGFHIHEEGDCSAKDFSSAKGHWNPEGKQHGGPGDGEHHAGDLGNIEVGAEGRGRLELVAKGITVAKGAHSVVGKAVILHENEDDLTTPPTGNAGGKIGCGEIELEPED